VPQLSAPRLDPGKHHIVQSVALPVSCSLARFTLPCHCWSFAVLVCIPLMAVSGPLGDLLLGTLTHVASKLRESQWHKEKTHACGDDDHVSTPA